MNAASLSAVGSRLVSGESPTGFKRKSGLCFFCSANSSNDRSGACFRISRLVSFCAFLEHTDYHIGRLIDTLHDLNILDDTLIYVIIGDNGASAEGTLNGLFNETCIVNGMVEIETMEFLKSRIDDFGGPNAYNHYAVVGRTAPNPRYFQARRTDTPASLNINSARACWSLYLSLW